MLASADFSPCRSYRYSLSRIWNRKLPVILFVGLNPSTADETANDPTVRRCIGFARAWGFGGLVLVNLFAYRATNPADLLNAKDPVGPRNDDFILKNALSAGRTVVAWGAKGNLLGRDHYVLSLLSSTACLGTTKDGAPRHPLYIRADTRLRPFSQSSFGRETSSHLPRKKSA